MVTKNGDGPVAPGPVDPVQGVCEEGEQDHGREGDDRGTGKAEQRHGGKQAMGRTADRTVRNSARFVHPSRSPKPVRPPSQKHQEERHATQGREHAHGDLLSRQNCAGGEVGPA